MLMLHVSDVTLMALWSIFTKTGQPRDHKHNRRVGGILKRDSTCRTKILLTKWVC